MADVLNSALSEDKNMYESWLKTTCVSYTPLHKAVHYLVSRFELSSFPCDVLPGAFYAPVGSMDRKKLTVLSGSSHDLN